MERRLSLESFISRAFARVVVTRPKRVTSLLFRSRNFFTIAKYIYAKYIDGSSSPSGDDGGFIASRVLLQLGNFQSDFD